MSNAIWTEACSLEELKSKGQKVIKKSGKQVLLIRREGKTFACNNRCPHEGYPLAEGTLTGTCTLTCNWHNWKFDLTTGEAMVGGDAVRLYPTRINEGVIEIDLADPAPGQKLPKILDNLNEAYGDYDYGRIARELARFEKDGGDLKDVMRKAIARSHDHFEYGMSHAYAAAADWMSLSEKVAEDDDKRLITFLEPTAHMAWDTLREPAFTYSTNEQPFDADALVLAIEEEREDDAIALIRGGVSGGLKFSDMEPALARAALAHYQDFGHASIYVLKIGELAQHLGEEITLPATLALVRLLIFARREDLIPEFRMYGDTLQGWDGKGAEPVSWQDFKGLSVRQALARTLKSSSRPLALYDALLAANAWNMLHFDLKYQKQTGTNIAHNVDWLDFTHGITFANSVRELCTRYPDLWPAGLLQMACFLGRNTPFTDEDLEAQDFEVADVPEFLETAHETLFDHGQFEHIVSCHFIKLITAIQSEIEARPDGPQGTLMLAALNRFFHSSVKRRHVLRTARQARNFVELEG